MGRRSREKRQRRQEDANRTLAYTSSSTSGIVSGIQIAAMQVLPYILFALIAPILILEREIAIIGVLPGMLLVFDRGLAIRRALLARDWKQTTATVLTSTVRRDPNTRDDHIFWSPVVTYSYEVGGVSYTGKRISLTGHGVRNSSDGATHQALYQLGVGQRIQVWYNPAKPSQSALHTHISISSWLVFAIGVTLLGISVPRLVEVFSR